MYTWIGKETDRSQMEYVWTVYTTQTKFPVYNKHAFIA